MKNLNENLNEKQKAALSALLKEYEKGLQVIAPTPLPNGDIMECDWRPGRVCLIGVLPKGVVFSGAVRALEGKAREELLRRIKERRIEWNEFCNHRLRWQWEVDNAIKAVKEGNLSNPSEVLFNFRMGMEGDRDFLRGLLEGVDESEPKKDDEPKKEGKNEKLSYPTYPAALEVLREAARRKKSPKYAKMKNPDIIFSLITDGKPAYRYTIMEGEYISGEKIAEYERRDDWGKERMRDDVKKAIRRWSLYLSAYLSHLGSHKG